MPHLISVSLLNADFGQLKDVIAMVNQSETDWFHLDIMDGVFVPNISFGFPVVETVKKYAAKPLDVHLMIVEPDKYIESFAKAGADLLTVHVEACPHLHRTIQQIKACGMKAGVAINPHTPVESLEDIIADLDLVLVMTVNPGFGGQSFIEHSYQKITRLKNMIIRSGSKAQIETDGGIDLSNARKLVDAGVDILVVGSYIFKSKYPSKTVSDLKKA